MNKLPPPPKLTPPRRQARRAVLTVRYQKSQKTRVDEARPEVMNFLEWLVQSDLGEIFL